MENMIKVFVQGETDWLIYDYNKSDLDKLYQPSLDKDLTSGALGLLLDGDPIHPITKEQRIQIGGVLAKYVANLNAYEAAKRFPAPTIFITSFRSSKPKKRGYLTRVTGIIPYPIDHHSNLGDNERVYFGFLEALKVNAVYFKDCYDSDSTFHMLMSRLNPDQH